MKYFKQVKKCVAVFLVLLLVAGVSPTYVKAANDVFVKDGLEYTSQGNGNVKVTDFTGTQKDVVIPSTVIDSSETTYNVTALDSGAFQNNTVIESVVLPDTLKDIEDMSFYCCTSLTSVQFGNQTKSIGTYAFGTTGLTSVELPDSITTLGEAVFAYCHSLASVKLPSKLTYISSQLFYETYSLTSLTLPETIKEINSEAFCESGIREINFPEGLKKIGVMAFIASKLEHIVLPVSLTNVGSQAFATFGLTKTVLIQGGTLTTDSSAFAFGDTTIVYVPKDYDLEAIRNSDIHDSIIKRYGLADVEVTQSPKSSYTAKENFDPSGLIIRRDYKVEGESDVFKEGFEVVYNDTTKDDFTFDKTELVTSDTTVEGTYQGSPFTIDITVAKATPTYQLPTDLSEYEGKTLKSVTLPDGFSWKDNTKVIVPNKEYDAIYTPDDTDNYEVVEVRIPVEAIRYTITSNKEDWQEGTITFTCNGRLSDLLSVKIDGIEIDASKYEIKEGSTIVTLKEAYRKELSEAKHTITLVYDGMEINKEFKVSTKKAPEAPDPDDPDTPDTPDVDVPNQPDTPDVDVPNRPDTPDVDVPDQPDTPDVPKQPDTPEKPKQPVDNSKDKNETAKKDETETPDTSDTTSMVYYVSILLLSSITLCALGIRKRFTKHQ